MKNRKKDVKLLIIIVFTFTLGIVTSGLTISYAAETLSSKNIHYDNTNSGGSSTNVAGAIDELYATADDQDILKKEIIDTIYPVGSVYITTTESKVDDVVARFGGTWERYATDTTLVGYKEGTNTINATGGSKTVTLSNTNLPNHTHTTSSKNVTNWTATENGAHNHGIGVMSDGKLVGMNIDWPGGAGITNRIGWSDSEIMYGRVNAGFTQTTGSHGHTVTGTIPSLTTNSCTNCSSSPINIQNPYVVVYMYKRTS